MKFIRLLLVVVAVMAAALAAVVAAAFIPAVQTWAARMALAARPALHGSVGSVAAGWRKVDVSGLHLELNGAVLTLPSLEAELPLGSSAWDRSLRVHRLVAKGWTLDLTRAKAPSIAQSARLRPPRGGFLPAAYAADAGPGGAAVQVFQGIFGGLVLPLDVAIDAVELEGDVLAPGPPGRATVLIHVAIAGGQLGSGRLAQFTVEAAAANEDPQAPFRALGLHGTLSAEMDTPRTFTRLAVKAELTARGGQVPEGVRLSVEVAAARGADEETYALSLARGAQTLASVLATLPAATHRLAGTWKLDLRDSDLAPFAMGRMLPAFTASGEGGFDAEPGWVGVHAKGRIQIAVDRPEMVLPPLAGCGPLTLVAQFDLAQRGDAVRVVTGSAALAGARPIAAVRVLQAFEFNLRNGELKVADPVGDLMGISLQGLPVAWLNRFSPGLALSGRDARAEWVVRAGAGGLALRSVSPLVAEGLGAARFGLPLARNLDLSLQILGDYAPQGWQVQLAPLTVSSAGRRLFTLEVRAGKLAGSSQPIKLAGTWSAELQSVMAQPIASGLPPLAGGRASGDGSASLGVTQQWETKFQVDGVAGLPSLEAQCRADVGAGGQVAFHAPLRLTFQGRITDLLAAGTWRPGGPGNGLDAQVTGDRVSVDDLELLAAPFLAGAPAPVAPGTPAAARGGGPFWSGASGRLTWAFKRLSASGFELADVGGTLQAEAGAVHLQAGRATWADGCQAKVDAGVTYDAASDRPYALQAAVTVNNFDAGAWFRSLHPDEPPVIDGKFSGTSNLTGRARDLSDLPGRLQGELHLSSKGGRFRALQTSVADSIRQAPSRLAGAIDTVSSLFGRRPDSTDATSRSIDKAGQAVIDFTNRISDVHYDQINVTAVRGADLTLHLVELSLIAPEERLTGSGQIAYDPGLPLSAQALSLDFRLGVRGKVADLLGSVGLLRNEQDDLGYTPMAQPIHLGGTLGNIDQSQWRDLLVQAALRKATSGLLDKLLGK